MSCGGACVCSAFVFMTTYSFAKSTEDQSKSIPNKEMINLLMKPWANQMGPSSITLIGKEQLLALAPDLE